MANGSPLTDILVSGLVIFALFVWFLACWVWPVIKLRDKETTETMKTVWSGWLIIAGMGPIFYGIYTTYKAQGNAASNNTGGNAPPGTFVVEPNLPSNVAGSSPPAGANLAQPKSS